MKIHNCRNISTTHSKIVSILPILFNSYFIVPVHVGRRTDNPKPQIIFGGVSVQSNHGKFEMLDNGLIQFELISNEAYEQTLINGKRLPNDDRKQVLNHLDKIYFGSGAMLLFKYPMQRKVADRVR